jgi:hypothetical protein
MSKKLSLETKITILDNLHNPFLEKDTVYTIVGEQMKYIGYDYDGLHINKSKRDNQYVVNNYFNHNIKTK